MHQGKSWRTVVGSPLGVVLGVAATIVALFLLRRYFVLAPLEDELTCSGCLWWRQGLADGPFLFFLFLIAATSLWVRWQPVRILLRLLALAIALVYVADIYVYDNFQVRLQVRDVVIYGAEARLSANQFLLSLTLWQKAAALLSISLVLWLVFSRHPRQRGPAFARAVAVAAAGSLLTLAANLAWHPVFPSNWVVRNVVAHNLQQGVADPYTVGFQEQLRREALAAPLHCIEGHRQRPNVVLLITESWSPYHSHLFSGINDWTSKLDRIAVQGRYYSHFFAGGENTNAGLISILAGYDFYSPVKDSMALAPFDGVWGLDTTLPKAMRAQGYRTVFMSNGNLSFSGKGAWLKDIGFDQIEGHDAKEYDGVPRLNFDAPPDGYLYRKALSFISQPHDQPYLLVLENVSTHHPYTHPYTLERSEEAVFRYLDQTVSALYRRLKAEDFFQGNVFMVVSDHRAMTPVRPAEAARFGASAPARIPAFVISSLVPPGQFDGTVHQSDILPSMVALAAPQVCGRNRMADIFGTDMPPKRCMLHAPNSDWNAIRAYCPDGEVVTRLRGDRSFAESAPPDPAEAASVVQAVAIRRNFTDFYRLRVAAAPAVPAVAGAIGAGGAVEAGEPAIKADRSEQNNKGIHQ